MNENITIASQASDFKNKNFQIEIDMHLIIDLENKF